MAKGRKTGGRDFVPGQSGNPNGRPPIPVEIKEARKFNQLELERVVNRFIYMTPGEAAEALKEEPSFLNQIVVQILEHAADKGDQQRLEWIALRLIGKVKDVVEVTTPAPFTVRSSLAGDTTVGLIPEKKEGA